MNINIDELKKKIIYRSKYRGNKELDKLLSSFTNKFINTLNDKELKNLHDFLEIDDENLYKYYLKKSTTSKIEDNKITKLFKEFKFK